MFNNSRCATRGINAEIPLALQLILWKMIDEMEVAQKDYLQVFTLCSENGKQKIIHEQEQPDYRKEYIFSSDYLINEKIYVIDDGDYSTMLLWEEY